jgi:hypothetical protein
MLPGWLLFASWCEILLLCMRFGPSAMPTDCLYLGFGFLNVFHPVRLVFGGSLVVLPVRRSPVLSCDLLPGLSDAHGGLSVMWEREGFSPGLEGCLAWIFSGACV